MAQENIDREAYLAEVMRRQSEFSAQGRPPQPAPPVAPPVAPPAAVPTDQTPLPPAPAAPQVQQFEAPQRQQPAVAQRPPAPRAASSQRISTAGRPISVLAILSLVSAFFFAPLGVVLGHIARSRIKQRRQRGRLIAIFGLIVGYFNIVLWFINLFVGVYPA